MDQPNSQPQQPQKPAAQELPHLVVEEPRRGIAATLGVLVLSLMLLGIPIGIFLVSQRTQVLPQAAVTQNQPEVITGIFLESKLSSGEDVIPVNVYVKSPLDAINLVNAQISYNPGLLSFEKIATNAAQLNQPVIFNKWVEASFDNEKGKASVIAGLPNPGAKTGSPNDEKIYLATLYLKPKATGTTVLQVTPQSQILRNSDNENIFTTGNDLALNLTASARVSPSASTPSGRSKPDEKEEPLIVITQPVPAANYSYFKPINIIWSSFEVVRISQINLYVNGELLGSIAQNLEARSGEFSWQPQDTLALHNIQPANTYKIEITGISKDGIVAKKLSEPFGILGVEEITGSPPNPETFSQNQLNITDFSRALTDYLVVPLKDQSLDLNKDGVVNELDLFLIRQNLLQRGIIK